MYWLKEFEKWEIFFSNFEEKSLFSCKNYWKSDIGIPNWGPNGIPMGIYVDPKKN